MFEYYVYILYGIKQLNHLTESNQVFVQVKLINSIFCKFFNFNTINLFHKVNQFGL